MRFLQHVITGFIALALACGVPLCAIAQETPEGVHRMRLASGSAPRGSVATLELLLTSTSEVQGLVAVFEWDGTLAEGVELIPGPVLDVADLVVRRVEADFMVLGVVLDTDGVGEEVIEPGEDILIARVQLRCIQEADAAVDVPIVFADGKHAATEDGPILDNVISVGGLSITQAEGLELGDGLLTCTERPRVSFSISEGGAEPGNRCGTLDVTMDNPLDAIEGYVLAIGHPPRLTLQAIETAGTAAETYGADFTKADIFPEGGTLGVILDLFEPFEGNTIPPGEGHVIARLTYCCDAPPAVGEPPQVFPIRFVDGQLGVPPKDNIAVSGGLTLFPSLSDGSFTCPPLPAGEVCDDGADNDGDAKIDCEDPDCAADPACTGKMFACGARELGPDGLPPPVEGSVGGTFEVCFFYKSPEDNIPGPVQLDHVQGLSMAVCFPCTLSCKEGSFDIAGTIVEAMGAEFVSHQCDNDPADGDGCELIIGILVDALPPFDGATLPPTDTFFRVGCLTFEAADDPALCGTCQPIEFCDGADGRGKVPIKNLISAENRSMAPQLLNCEVCLQGRERFHRGDCNFSRMGNMSVDIADAAAVISFVFGRGARRFEPPCVDACDCNDDGRVDLADSMCLLRFLFQFGPFPPAPGPGFTEEGQDLPPGEDPTEDMLDCRGGRDCPQ